MQVTAEAAKIDLTSAFATFRQRFSYAQIYRAYHVVQQSLSPGGGVLPATLLHASHFLVTRHLEV